MFVPGLQTSSDISLGSRPTTCVQLSLDSQLASSIKLSFAEHIEVREKNERRRHVQGGQRGR